MRPIALLSLLSLTCLGACGTPNFGSVQTVRVDTQPSADARCTLSNAAGEWTIARTPGEAEIAKSPSTLRVACETADGRRGTGSVAPQAMEPFTGSARVAAFFGSEVDPESGQSYRYPPYLRVVLSSSARRSGAAASRLALSPMLAERITGGPADTPVRTAPVTGTQPPQPGAERPRASDDAVRLQSPEPGRKPPSTAAEEEAGAARILGAIGADRGEEAPAPPAGPLDLRRDAPQPDDGEPPELIEEGTMGGAPEGLVQPLPPEQESRLRGRSARDAAGLPPLAPLQPAEPVELAPSAPPVSEPTTDVLPRCAFGDIVVPAEPDTCMRSGGELLD